MDKNYQYNSNQSWEGFSELTGEVKDFLVYIKASGCKGFDCSENSMEILRKWDETEVVTNDSLEKVLNDISNCRSCGLHENRTHILFGEGPVNAKLIFVGEWPGAEDDQQGKPFVGKAGQLLTKIIQAMNLTREDVYICNVMKCRPPVNRKPYPNEIQSCLPYLRRQINLIRPDFICALGTFAAQTLLETHEPISKLRGDFHDYEGIRVMPTYHPSYLLQKPERKREVWEDMKKLMKEMS